MTRSFTRRTLLVLGLLLLAALLIYLAWKASLVFILTFVAIMLGVVFRSFANVLPLPYKAALPVAVLLILAVLIGFGWYEGPRLLAQLQGLSEQLPLSVQRLEQELMQAPGGEWLVGNAPFLSLPEDTQTASDSEDSSLQSLASTFSRVLGSLTGLLSALVAVLSHILYVLFVSIFFAAGAETYASGVVKLVPKAHRPHAREVLKQLYRTLQGWFVGRLLSMVIVGTLIGLGLWLLGVPFAFGLGFITFLFEFIPTIGPWLAGIPAVLVALTQGGSAALWVAILFIALELLEGNVLLPLVQRRMIELPPALLLFSIFLMGTLFGFVGVLVAAPLAAVILVLVKMLYVQETLGDEAELPNSSS